MWDDQEEMRYREWMRMEIEKKEDAEFSEFSAEDEYRRKMREAAEQRSGDQVCEKFIRTGVANYKGLYSGV